MADLQDTLHSDTIDWLNYRDGYRSSYRLAWETLPLTVGPPIVTDADQQGTPWKCEVDANNQFSSINPGFWVYINTGNPESAWPPADNITNELITGLSAVDQTAIVLEKAAKWQLQINSLESYRRVLLNRRQRRKQLITAWSHMWSMEGQSQIAMKAALQNQKLGQHVEPA